MVYGQAKLGVTKLSKATRQLNPLRLLLLGLTLLVFLAACASEAPSATPTSDGATATASPSAHPNSHAHYYAYGDISRDG